MKYFSINFPVDLLFSILKCSKFIGIFFQDYQRRFTVFSVLVYTASALNISKLLENIC